MTGAAHLAGVAVAAAAMTAAAMPGMIALARRRGWMDVPGGDALKVHARPVPRVGGLAMAVAWAGVTAAGAWRDRGVAAAFLAALPALGVAALGARDDRAHLPRGLRLAVEAALGILAGVLAVSLGVLPAAPGLGTGVPGLAGAAALLACFAVVSVNAMNLQDGRDGLAGTVTVVGGAVAAGVAALRGRPDLAAVAAGTVGLAVGFLPWNLPPARVFMGDAGAYLLGFLRAVPAVGLALHDGTPRGLAGGILLLGLPAVEAATTAARRAARGAPLFPGDRDHLYDRMARAGAGPRGVIAWTGILEAAVTALGAWLLLP